MAQKHTASERTPLLHLVAVTRPRPRYPHTMLRRACTLFLSCNLIVVVILFLLPDVFGLPDAPWLKRRHPEDGAPHGDGLNYEQLQTLLSSTPVEAKIEEWNRYYTSGPHLAGKNLSQAEWTRDRWQEFGVADSNVVSYDVYLNYPAAHRLALLERASGAESAWSVKYEARLEEDVLAEDSTSGLPDRVPTFHGYSANGNVTAPYVFVNYGTFQDFEDLQKANVSLEGKIALAKYGKIFRGLKVKRAQEVGMVGAILYTDPGDDGNVTVANGFKPYPEGPARQPSSVQRGSTQFLSIAPGDPTTPGYPSKPGAPRQDPHDFIPSIPSLPLSYEDALPLLTALNGIGPKASSINKYWEGGGLGYRGVEYNIGPSPDTLAVNIYNQQDYVTTPIWDVIGIINGTLPDEVVILGNHRDAWIAGGSADPHSGSAALNEVVRSFGEALKQGWKPLRTIVFCSWDGEEYGLLGSTEWVEEYLPWLSKSAVAYLNVDIGTVGPNFGAAASPLLNSVLYEVTSLVRSPNQTVEGQTVRDTWSGEIGTIGSGSDFTAFQDFAGIPCADMGFGPGPTDPIYHYHSNYDSFDWMRKFGDPGWHYHVTMAKIFALTAARLAAKPVIGFNATDYATALKGYLASAEKGTSNDTLFAGQSASFSALESSLDRLLQAAIKLDADASRVAEQQSPAGGTYGQQVSDEARTVNDKYKYLERQFLYSTGLDGRPWFKHVVFAPGIWTGYSGVTFPGLVENIGKKDVESVQRWIDIIKGRVDAAVDLLD
ncbi:MAG: hypothetical protein M1816_000884 [Peltula sp. TS41687]|nr:MAG: hypothetical protein M1816_000884 [Peltula sp. TS41687]